MALAARLGSRVPRVGYSCERVKAKSEVVVLIRAIHVIRVSLLLAMGSQCKAAALHWVFEVFFSRKYFGFTRVSSEPKR